MRTERLFPEGDSTDETIEDVRRERDFFRHLFEHVVETFPHPVGVVDDDGSIVGWNSALADLVGSPAEDVYGEQAYDVVGTEGEREVLCETVTRLGETIVEDDPRVGETDGGDLWAVRASGFPLEDTDGTVVGGFQVNTIVTDIVRKNRRLADVQERMREEVGAGTAELHDSLAETAEYAATIETATTAQHHDVEGIRTDLDSLSEDSETVSGRANRVDEHCREMDAALSASAEAVDAVADSIDAASELCERVESLAQELEAGIDDVERVTHTIDDIANQTNLLAVNAGIEAARAVDDASAAADGSAAAANAQRFEVVADEVKALASQSQEEVEAVRAQMHSVQLTAEETVSGIAELQSQLRDAVEESQTLSETHRTITDHVGEVTGEITTVASAAADQSSSVSRLRSDVETFAERTATVSEEISEIADRTATQSERVVSLDETVQALVSDLDVDNEADS